VYTCTHIQHPNEQKLRPHTCSKESTPGNGQIATCLTKRVLDTDEGNIAGMKVNKKCSAELGEWTAALSSLL